MQAVGKLKPIGPYLLGEIVEYIERNPSRPRPSLSLCRWHVLIVMPQKEGEVEEELEDLEIAGYVPREIKKRRMKAEHYCKIRVPMIPGYVFAGFDPGDDRWHAIRGIRSVHRLLMINFRPCPLGEREMQYIRESEAEALKGPIRRFKWTPKKGELVRVIDGPFAQFLGFVEELNPKAGTCVVELDIFRRKTPIELTWDQVEPGC